MTPPPAARPGGYLAFTSHFTTRTLATRLTAPLRVAGTVILNSSVWSSRLDGAILILVTCMDYSCSPCEDGAHCSVCCFLYDEKARSFWLPSPARPYHDPHARALPHAARAPRGSSSSSRSISVQAASGPGRSRRRCGRTPPAPAAPRRPPRCTAPCSSSSSAASPPQVRARARRRRSAIQAAFQFHEPAGVGPSRAHDVVVRRQLRGTPALHRARPAGANPHS